MDIALVFATDHAARGEAAHDVASPARTPMVPHVAETMRRVHADLRNGAAPSFETLLALDVAGPHAPRAG